MKRRLGFVFGLVALSVLVAVPVRADLAATVPSGGSVEVFLTIDAGAAPSFNASPPGGLLVGFSPPSPAAEGQWASTMTIDAAAAAPGDYEFPMTVTSDAAVLTVQVQVTVLPRVTTSTTAPASTTAATTSTTSAGGTTTPTSTLPPSTEAPTTEPPSTTVGPPVTTAIPAPATTATTEPATTSTTTTAPSAIGSNQAPGGIAPGFGTTAAAGAVLPVVGAAMVIAGGVLMMYAHRHWPRHRRWGS